MTVEEYFGDWMKVIDKKELLDTTNKVMSIAKTKPICPDIPDIFRAFELCPYNNLKIVMLGKEPYPQKGVATGVLFGNRADIKELNPSLNIIKEAAINFEVPHSYINFDPTLESWAKQGVLMINSALTVEMNRIGSHVMVWRTFISCLLKQLSQKEPGLIYVLFGKQAQTFEPYINKQFNTVIKIEHPAFFARTHTKMPYELFTDLSKLTEEKYGVPIQWYNEY